MMLLPYRSEPATGSLIPSMSTGGAATKAVMKHTVAANRVGIISTPNQPTYRRLLVEVTHWQNCSQVDVDCCLESVVAIVLKKGYVVVRGGTEYSIPTLPSRVGMKDCCLDTLFSPGKACKTNVGEPSLVDVFILRHIQGSVNNNVTP